MENPEPVTYDAMGNITSLGDYSYTWTGGRQLKSVTSEDQHFEYFYNADGKLEKYDMYDVVTSHSEDGESTETIRYSGTVYYFWNGDSLVSMCLEEDGQLLYNSRIIYDTDGEAMGICLNDSGTFLYQKDLQGDIVALITPNGQIVLEYIYDAYGNININTPDNSVGSAILAMFILALNPLSYRGYLYAPGIGVSYYLGSRFYSPEICRFMNADIHQDTNTNAVGTNMFAYCNNNPVNCIDPNGEMAIVAKMLSVAIIFLATYLIYTYVSTSVSALFHQLQTSTVRTALQQNTALQGYATNAFTNFVKELRYAVIQRVELAIVEAYLKVNELSVKSPHKHHIVAKDAPAAELGRSVLHASKIPINSKYNLVELDANFHIVLHTSFYHTVVGLYLLDVWKETASTKSVQHALALIAISLKSFELMI